MVLMTIDQSFSIKYAERLQALPTENIILGGDFNFVMDYILDSNYSRQNNPRARNAFLEILEQHSLVDTWTEANPGIDGYLYLKEAEPIKYGRLDRLYIY